MVLGEDSEELGFSLIGHPGCDGDEEDAPGLQIESKKRVCFPAVSFILLKWENPSFLIEEST